MCACCASFLQVMQRRAHECYVAAKVPLHSLHCDILLLLDACCTLPPHRCCWSRKIPPTRGAESQSGWNTVAGQQYSNITAVDLVMFVPKSGVCVCDRSVLEPISTSLVESFSFPKEAGLTVDTRQNRVIDVGHLSLWENRSIEL